MEEQVPGRPFSFQTPAVSANDSTIPLSSPPRLLPSATASLSRFPPPVRFDNSDNSRVNFPQNLNASPTRQRSGIEGVAVRSPPPPPVNARPPLGPPSPSIFVRARRFRQYAAAAYSEGNRTALTESLVQLCSDFDGEVRDRIRGDSENFDFDRAWNQAGEDLSSSLSEATGANSSAVQNSLAATGGDVSMSLLDLLHSTGDPVIESCAVQASAGIVARRQEAASAEAFRHALAEANTNPDDASAEDVAGALDALQQRMSRAAFLRLLGHCYRPGSRSPLAHGPMRAGGDDPADYGDERDDGGPGDGDGDSDGDGDGDGDSGGDGSQGSGDDDTTPISSAKKREKGNLVPTASSSDANESAVRMVREPMMWKEGTAPTGGFELETFQTVYNDWFSIMSGVKRGTGWTFKSRIDASLVPGIRGNLLMSPGEWDKASDEEILKKIMKNLNFRHSDYYHSQLELTTMPYPAPDPASINCDEIVASSYKSTTNKMLYIIDQARKNGVKFRWSNVKKCYKDAIKGYASLERFFNRKDHQSLDEVVSYTNRKMKKMTQITSLRKHDRALAGRAAGVRSDIGGGKHESSEATPPSRGRGRRGRGRGGRGGGGLNERSGVDKRRDEFSRSNDHKSKDEASAKKLSSAYAKEDALPRGRYWHKRTPFCPSEGACSCKFCQGCGWHGQGSHWHDRPRCRATAHPLFVKEGYFHEKHPDKLNIYQDSSASLRVMMGEPTYHSGPTAPADLRGVSASSGNPGCAYCPGPQAPRPQS
jgi:hypothetical protein